MYAVAATRGTGARSTPGSWKALCGAIAGLATLVAVAVVAPVAIGADDANRSSCTNEALTGFRSYMPDCRAYELVSPPYKQGGLLKSEPGAISEDGRNMIVEIIGATGGVENDQIDQNLPGSVNVYRLTRADEGWRYTPLTPPATQYSLSALLAVSNDPKLTTTLWGAQTSGYALHKEDIYLQKEMGRELTLVGSGERPELASQELGIEEELGLVGASNDLTHSVFSVQAATVAGHSDLWPGDMTEAGKHSLYEYVYSGTPSPEPMLVGVAPGSGEAKRLPSEDPTLVSNCGTELGAANGASAYNAISKNGEKIFFTALECGGSPAVNELYARVNGEHTVSISEPALPGGGAGECTAGEPCATAVFKNGEFQGADEAGRHVFFLSEQPLVDGAPEEGEKLYEERLEGAKVVEVRDVSNPAAYAGVNPEVQGVVRVSENGERVFFVSKAVLAGPNAEHRYPENEAFNLYVYGPAKDGTPRVVFVAKLLTNTPAHKEEETIKAAEESERAEVEGLAEQAGEAAEREALSKGASPQEATRARETAQNNAALILPGTLGPSGTLSEDKSVWEATDTRPAQATPDGRFLAFVSSADLRAEGLAKVPQLFEYDIAAERLTRVSIGQGGLYDNNGDVSAFHQTARIPSQSFRKTDPPTAARFQLAVSDDGSQVFFTSAAPLTPGATSGAPSVFEYREGNVYLISDGKDSSDTGIGTSSVQLYGADPGGGDVFFTTADPLVPQSGEMQQTLYDAREGGGFPAPALTPGCLGETCRGAAASVAGLPSPGSATQGAGDNLAPSPRAKPTSPTRAQKLARALKACARLRKKKRAACRTRARRLYGKKSTASRARESSRSSAAETQLHGNGRSK